MSVERVHGSTRRRRVRNALTRGMGQVRREKNEKQSLGPAREREQNPRRTRPGCRGEGGRRVRRL